MMTAAPQAVHAHSGHSPPPASGQPPRWICSNGSSPPHPGQFPSGSLIACPFRYGISHGTWLDSSRSWHADPCFPWTCGGVSPAGWVGGRRAVRRSVGDPAAAELALYPCLPEGAGPVHPGLVHAPGGAVPPRVPPSAGGHLDARLV